MTGVLCKKLNESQKVVRSNRLGINSPGYKGTPHEWSWGTVKDLHQPDKPEAAFMRRGQVALRLYRRAEQRKRRHDLSSEGS